MPQASLTLTYSPRAAATAGDPLDLLQIEQDDWHRTTGAITKQQMVRWLGAMLEHRAAVNEADCAMVGPDLVCLVRVYPRRAGLVYRFLASWGTLSERSVETVELRELVQFRLTDEARCDHPVREILSVDWAGDCWGPEGEVVAAPVLTAAGETVQCSRPVYGTAEVRYLCERHSYALTVPRRADAIDNHFSAVVVGVYAGGLNWLEIDMPPGIEQFEQDPDAVCMGSTGGRIGAPDEDDGPPRGSGGDRHTVLDYCTKEVLSDNYITGA